LRKIVEEKDGAWSSTDLGKETEKELKKRM
jgi:hypothetical protein